MASSSSPDEQRPQEQAAAPAASSSPKPPDSDPANSNTDTNNKRTDEAPAVRFASAIEEIAPKSPAPEPVSEVGEGHDETSAFTEVAADQLKALTQSLQSRHLQEHRMNTYQFEAFSLPASRVPSRDDESSAEATRQSTATSGSKHSPHNSPRLSGLASPPLTPSGSDPSKLAKDTEKRPSTANEPPTITPAPTSSHEKSPATSERRPLAHRPASDHVARRYDHDDEQEESQNDDPISHRRGMFRLGPSSVPVSRESSPTRTAAGHFYTKPMTAHGDANDPYAKGRRPPQQTTADRRSVDSRFVFSKKKKTGSPSSSKTSLSEKRGPGLFGLKNGSGDLTPSDTPHGGSMSDLKRFFRKSGHHHHKKGDTTPTKSKSAAKTPPAARSTQQLPFGDDHGLSTKYGKLGRVLGSGAGGSVRLMKRKEDDTVFAVKEFRARHTYESEKEYNKKVTAEFCVGSTLHHGNIIETLDILQEKGRWFEVMEYAPYDLFAIVMSGKMTRPEVTCCFLQILSGVTYLHSLGLAHRDLKLDNVVVSGKGIMKIIDFGSAHVFKYPFENGSVPARGIVGSDPYLAPEVYDSSKAYDAAGVDIWSLAIIYCCMTLRRFPWKIPRFSDNSYKLFASDPTPGHDPKKLVGHSKSTNDLANTVPRDFMKGHPEHEHHNRNHHHLPANQEGTAPTTSATPTTQSSNLSNTNDKKEVIRGPWRILRLLPRESRHIIHRMLDINPKTRAGMEEIMEEPWIADTVICQQLDNGEVISAEDHTHVLEPPAAPPKNV